MQKSRLHRPSRLYHVDHGTALGQQRACWHDWFSAPLSTRRTARWATCIAGTAANRHGSTQGGTTSHQSDPGERHASGTSVRDLAGNGTFFHNDCVGSLPRAAPRRGTVNFSKASCQPPSNPAQTTSGGTRPRQVDMEIARASLTIVASRSPSPDCLQHRCPEAWHRGAESEVVSGLPPR